MILTARHPTEAEVRSLIHQWLRVLAAGDYDAAAAMVGPVGAVNYSGASLRACVGAYRRAFREARSSEARAAALPVVTDPSTMDPSGERLTIYPATPVSARLAEYDLPLDGVWSDLTAVFSLTPSERGYELGLYDLRVM